ncbi:uncharacterized protein LOC128880091 [Hylaeus volcanicus]|uniref:uncharacterized protein LOC128880091 n=1 Tax=Hylaeus volcanicus TaxID=313075 RepID=UPI0023B785CB|nr:uncharacterized protein LOC128880091 [Hylaeus volcanicus]
MISINMRVFKTVLVLVAFFSNRVKCLPVANETMVVESPSSTPPVLSSSEVDYYDQRQNGTDNYRIHVDGVMFVLAPVEALLLAGTAGDKPDLPILDPSKPTSNKPVPAPKSSNRDASHLVNLLVPFLRRFRQG